MSAIFVTGLVDESVSITKPNNVVCEGFAEPVSPLGKRTMKQDVTTCPNVILYIGDLLCEIVTTCPRNIL